MKVSPWTELRTARQSNEGAFGIADDIEDLEAREPPPHVVVGLVPVLLEVDERSGDPDDLILQRQAVEPGAQPGRNVALGELACDPLHHPVVEGAAEAVSQRLAIAARYQAPRCGVHQEVEQRVVGRRHTLRRRLACLGRLLSFVARRVACASRSRGRLTP